MFKIRSVVLSSVLGSMFLPVVHAQESFSQQQLELIQADEKQQQEEKASRDFMGVSFGVALGVTENLEDDQVESARVIDGIVRVEERRNTRPRLFLETHKFIGQSDDKLKGWGPFIAVELGQEDLLQGLGVGWMWGFRDDKADDSSLNLGIGWFVTDKIQKLGSGIEDGRPLPGAETEIRYRYDADGSVLAMASFTF